jgi:hypothetical protein
MPRGLLAERREDGVRTAPRKALSLPVLSAGCVVLLFCVCSAPPVQGVSAQSNVLCRPELASTRRQELISRLREITGWPDLHFNKDGALRVGAGAHTGGSPAARELLAAAINGRNMVVLEDASDRSDVVFCRVALGRWANHRATRPPAYVLLIDFADFSRVIGDREALAAFNVGWGVLHEISHVVHDHLDSDREGEVGECERLINRMRRECDLAERAEYCFTLFPGAERTEFKTRFVRLAFEQWKPQTGKKRRLWLMWDALLVGGLEKGR